MAVKMNIKLLDNVVWKKRTYNNINEEQQVIEIWSDEEKEEEDNYLHESDEHEVDDEFEDVSEEENDATVWRVGSIHRNNYVGRSWFVE